MNLLKRILIMLIAVCFILSPINVYASYNGGQGVNGLDVSGKLTGGPSAAKTGIQIYIVDKETGTPLVSKAGMIFRDTSYKSCTKKILQSKLGKLGWGNRAVASNLPYPVIWNGSGWSPNGNAVKAWLLEEGNTMQRYEYYIKLLYGESTLTEIQNNKSKYSLVVEAISWSNLYIYNKGVYSKTNSPLMGNADGWARIYEIYEQPKGDSYIWKMTHAALPYSMVLEEPRFGLGAHAGEEVRRLTNDEIRNSGYGLHIIDLEDDNISTWDRENYHDTPGAAPDNPGGQNVTIVKNYYTADQNDSFISDDGCYTRTDSVKNISIDDEKNYVVVGWKISTSSKSSLESEPSKWNAGIPSTVTRSGNSSSNVELNETETSLYVLLKKPETKKEELLDTNYILSESSVTRRIWISEPDAQLQMPHIENHEFIWILKRHQQTCDGHYYIDDCMDTDSLEDEDEEPDHCGGHTEYCSNFEWKDKTVRLSISNHLKNNYPDILSTKDGWRFETSKGALAKRYFNNGNYDRTTTAEENVGNSGWDYVAVIHRGQDKLTVADWKNTDSTKNDLRDVSSSGYAVANTNQGRRKSSDYIDKFSLYFVNETSGTDNVTTYGASQPAPFTGEKCENSRGVILATPLSINDITVKVEVYSGSQSGGYTDTSSNESPVLNLQTNGFNTSSGRMIKGTGKITFHPFLEMKYDTLTATDKTVYVLGQYMRSIIPNSYAEINWNKQSDDNLKLISSQWSTHAQATSNYGTNNVLPGGSNLGLGIKQDDRQTVEITTYQVAVINEFKQQVDLTGGSDGGLTEEAAIQAHNDYVESVKLGLENLVVQQYVDKNPNKDTAFNGIEVNPGSDISSLNNKSSKASTEDKYYFREENEGSISNQGDLDVSVGGTSKVYVKISADTSGNILMNDKVVLTKDQDYTSLTGEAKLLDDKTYIIRKVAAALERNSGNDSDATWVSDGRWCNEAIDPLYVIIQKTVITTGFINPSERTNILDPKLIPYAENKSEMFTSYHISQFKMREQSETYQIPYVIGMFKGQTIQMKDMDMLYYSRTFWIPNVTTQDLH